MLRLTRVFMNSTSPPLPPAETPARRWPVRLILFGVVFALVIPGIVFAGVLISRIAIAERTRSEEAAQASALRIAETLDRELGNLAAALTALSTSPALASATLTPADLAAFDRQARSVAVVLGHDIVLAETAGQQLTNTRPNPASEPLRTLPIMGSMDTVRRAVQARGPAVSGLFQGGVTRTPAIAVIVPILRGDAIDAVLGINLRPAYISGLLQTQNLPPGWRASVLDAEDHILARSDGRFGRIGEIGSADMRHNTTGQQNVWAGTTRTGDPTLRAMQRQHLADWRVVVSVPFSIVEAPLRSTVLLLALLGALTLGTACLLALKLASSVTIPLQRLAAAANDLAQGRTQDRTQAQAEDLPAKRVGSVIAEVDDVSRALFKATRDLRARADALAAERAQLAAIIDTVPVGLVIAEAPGGRIVSGNRNVERILRQPLLHSATEHDYGEWVSHHPDGRLVQAHEYPLARVLHGEAHAELQVVYQRGDGTPYWVQLVAAPILAGDGAITGGVVAILDIDETVRAREALARFAESLETLVADRTAALEAANQRLRDEISGRAEAEEQLRQSQKMEAVGQLTGGIAHDFNNLLTVVMGSLDLLRRRAQDDRTKRLVDNALDGATRAATLTARLLAFSRRQPLQARTVDVNSLVAGMSDLLHRTLGEAVHVETVLAGGLWQTHADANQLENALLNLAVNARDAMASAACETDGTAGRLTIQTANAVLDAAAVAGETGLQPGEYVQVSVSDTGAGMTEDVIGRVFEPFFTTKPPGQGTGLGLSQVHGFVKQSGGHVTIRSRPGEGSTITIYLPRFDGSAAQADAARPAVPERRRRLTVLVVEDEAGVRRYSVEALRELGHTVLDAGDATAALRLLETHPAIDLLFTDVVLPQMNGARLAEEVHRRRPGLPVLFTSGYTGDDTGDDTGPSGLLLPGAFLLPKPFTLQDLALKLDEALQAGSMRPAGLEPATKPL